MRNPTICICENKDADQLRGNREADQRLCFRYTDSTIPLLSKSKISSFYRSPVLVQLSLCRTCSKTTLLVFPRDDSYIFGCRLEHYALILHQVENLHLKTKKQKQTLQKIHFTELFIRYEIYNTHKKKIHAKFQTKTSHIQYRVIRVQT